MLKIVTDEALLMCLKIVTGEVLLMCSDKVPQFKDSITKAK